MADVPKRLFIPFGELRPDSGTFMTSDLVAAEGVLPYGDKYFPLQGLRKRSPASTLPTGKVEPTEAIIHAQINTPSAGSPIVYAALKNAYYTANTSTEPWTLGTVALNGAATGADSLEAGYGGLLGFGLNEVYWQGHTALPRIRLAGAGDFFDLCTTPAGANAPKPRHMAPIGDRLLMGNCANLVAAGIGAPDVNQDFLWWSKTRDGRVWGNEASHPADNTGYTFLYDDLGPITGLFGSAEFAMIFKRRGLYRMDFAGAFGNEFSVADNMHGAVSSRGICSLGNDIFYWSDSGPCVYRSGQVFPLAEGRLALFLLGSDEQFPAASVSVFGCFADPVMQTVTWVVYIVSSVTGNFLNAGLVHYCVTTDRFSVTPYSYKTSLVDTSGANNQQFDQFAACCGGLPTQSGFVGNQAVFFFCGDTGVRGSLSTFGTASTFDALFPVNVKLKTGYMQIAGRASVVIQRVRPIWRFYRSYPYSTPRFRVSVYAKKKPWDEEAVLAYVQHGIGSDGGMDDRGFVTNWTTSQPAGSLLSFEFIVYHAVNGTALAADVRELEGIEIEYVEAGNRVG